MLFPAAVSAGPAATEIAVKVPDGKVKVHCTPATGPPVEVIDRIKEVLLPL